MGENRGRDVVVFLDADNTLWDTNGVYIAAQLRLLAAVEQEVGTVADTPDRLAFLRRFDQGLAERHHARLRYPPKFLVKALGLALTGMNEQDAVRLSWSTGRVGERVSNSFADRVIGQFLENLREMPALRSGVREGLICLFEQDIPLRVVTEGSRERVAEVARHHEVSQWLSNITEIRKTDTTFARLRSASGHPGVVLMVGDQLDRDIQPAKAAGLTTIYFPSAFRPKWEIREVEAQPEYTVSSFADIPEIAMTEMRRITVEKK